MSGKFKYRNWITDKLLKTGNKMEDKFREEFRLLLEKTIFSGDMDEKKRGREKFVGCF